MEVENHGVYSKNIFPIQFDEIIEMKRNSEDEAGNAVWETEFYYIGMRNPVSFRVRKEILWGIYEHICTSVHSRISSGERLKVGSSGRIT